MMPRNAARPNSTNANSPPDGRLKAKPRLAACESPESRPIARRTTTLISMNPKVTPIRASGISRTRPRLADIPDGDEEQAQEQSLEGFDVSLELVAEFAVREQHAGQKGAQRQGQAHLTHQQRGADDHQQAGRREGLGDARRGDDPQHRAQHITAADHDGPEHGDELERQPAARARWFWRRQPPTGAASASAGNTGYVLE